MTENFPRDTKIMKKTKFKAKEKPLGLSNYYDTEPLVVYFFLFFVLFCFCLFVGLVLDTTKLRSISDLKPK